jgi:hypothetical protein
MVKTRTDICVSYLKLILLKLQLQVEVLELIQVSSHWCSTIDVKDDIKYKPLPEIKRLDGTKWSNASIINQINIEGLNNISDQELANMINNDFLEPLRISPIVPIRTSWFGGPPWIPTSFWRKSFFTRSKT